jgi:hypothetical protein
MRCSCLCPPQAKLLQEPEKSHWQPSAHRDPRLANAAAPSLTLLYRTLISNWRDCRNTRRIWISRPQKVSAIQKSRGPAKIGDVVRKSTTGARPAAEDRSDMCPDLRDDRAIIDLCITTRASALGFRSAPLRGEANRHGRMNNSVPSYSFEFLYPRAQAPAWARQRTKLCSAFVPLCLLSASRRARAPTTS